MFKNLIWNKVTNEQTSDFINEALVSFHKLIRGPYTYSPLTDLIYSALTKIVHSRQHRLWLGGISSRPTLALWYMYLYIYYTYINTILTRTYLIPPPTHWVRCSTSLSSCARNVRSIKVQKTYSVHSTLIYLNNTIVT